MMEKLCASIEDTRKALGVGRTKVYELIKAGSLKTVKIGRRTLITTASIKAVAGEA